MRMWLVDPRIMCRKHLLGEHLEMHMFLGSIKRGISMDGYVQNNLLEPDKLFQRHEELVAEMKRRGMKHKSPMDEQDVLQAIEKMPKRTRGGMVNRDSAFQALIERCADCREGYRRIHKDD